MSIPVTNQPDWLSVWEAIRGGARGALEQMGQSQIQRDQAQAAGSMALANTVSRGAAGIASAIGNARIPGAMGHQGMPLFQNNGFPAPQFNLDAYNQAFATPSRSTQSTSTGDGSFIGPQMLEGPPDPRLAPADFSAEEEFRRRREAAERQGYYNPRAQENWNNIMRQLGKPVNQSGTSATGTQAQSGQEFNYSPPDYLSNLPPGEQANLVNNPYQLMNHILAQRGIPPESAQGQRYIRNAETIMNQAQLMAASEGRVTASPDEQLKYLDYYVTKMTTPGVGAATSNATDQQLIIAGAQMVFDPNTVVGQHYAMIAEDQEISPNKDYDSQGRPIGAPEFYWYNVLQPMYQAAGIPDLYTNGIRDTLFQWGEEWRSRKRLGEQTTFIQFMQQKIEQGGFDPFIYFTRGR